MITIAEAQEDRDIKLGGSGMEDKVSILVLPGLDKLLRLQQDALTNLGVHEILLSLMILMLVTDQVTIKEI